MIPEQFALLTALLSLVGGWDYLVSSIKGETKPNRVTWFLLSLFTGIAFFAALSDDVSWLLLSGLAVALLNTTSIFLVSFLNKNAFWKTTKQDYAFGLLALAGLILWNLTDSPEVAIVFSIVADFLALLPTVLKSYKLPSSENGRSFAIWTVAWLINILTIDNFTISTSAFAIYLLLSNALLAGLSYRINPGTTKNAASS